jgi:hypothetical protein
MGAKKIISTLMLATVCLGRAYASEDPKILEICQASIKASDAGWAAYEMLVSDLNKISIEGDACTSSQSAWPKCETTVQKLVGNNLEPLLMAHFAKPYIENLNKLCAPYIRDESGAVKLPNFEIKTPAIIIENSAELLRMGFKHQRTRSIFFEKLPSNLIMIIEASVFLDPKLGVERYQCFDVTVDLLNFVANEEVGEMTVDQWPNTNLCFDSLRFTSVGENDVILEKIMSRNVE